NLKWFTENKRLGIVLPELERMLRLVVAEEVIQRFEPRKASSDSKLTVKISSFSYRCGIPEDTSENGGGFVFDCRSIFNPGRFEESRKSTGRDKSVQESLEERSRMGD